MFGKRAPSAARRSICGGFRNGWPAQERKSCRWSSVISTTKFGSPDGSPVDAEILEETNDTIDRANGSNVAKLCSKLRFRGCDLGVAEVLRVIDMGAA